MKKREGLFGVLEGIDGAGTTTQTLLLKEYIERELQFRKVTSTSEPTDGIYGRKIKEILSQQTPASPETLARLFVLDSARTNNKERIKPMLEDGGIILSDRYRASSFAYQLMAGVPLEYITMIHEEQGNQLEIPDFTFYLDLSAEAAIERTRARTLTEKVNSEIFEVLEFQQRVRAQYKKIIERGLKYLGRVTVIDAANSEEKVASDIQEAFRGIYTKWISRKSE